MSIDLTKIIFRTTNKDAVNMGKFAAAVTKKVEEKVLSGAPDLQYFIGSFAALIADWVAVAKQPWWKLITQKDPFFSMREETRIFAKQWNLDADLIKALG